jgi:hypothetical protein
MQSWMALYAVTGGSAATLLGLLFVAISIKASSLSGPMHPNSRHLAEQAFQNYLVVLLVSLLSLFPSLSIKELCEATLVLIALRVVLALVRLYWAARQPYEPGAPLRSLRRQLPSLIGFGLLITAAVRLILDLGDSRTLFASAIVVLLFSATSLSWELLLRMTEEKRAAVALVEK